MYSIYVHILPDGKKYVGITSQDVEYRWQLGWGYITNKPFFNAIKSIGWINIQHKVLETVEDKETALKREEYYTLLWRSNEPEFGYNILAGRKYTKPLGFHQSEETKKKKSEKMKEFYKNKVFSEEERKQRSETAKKPIRLRNIKTKKILKFDSRESCAEFFRISVLTLRRFINGEVQIKALKDYKVLKTVKK